MTFTIAQESPLTADGEQLLAGSETALRQAYDITECSSFSAEQLSTPDVKFFVARQDGSAVGCVALVNCGPYGEIKRLFVPESARGKGIAKKLVQHVEQMARAAHTNVIRLETGSKLTAAVVLYELLGYARRGAFGGYEQGETTVFMEKDLTRC